MANPTSATDGTLSADSASGIQKSASTSSGLLAPPAGKTLGKSASSTSLRKINSRSSQKSSSSAVAGTGAENETHLKYTPAPGHVGNLSPAQQKALDELIYRLKEAGLLGDNSQAATKAQRRRHAAGNGTADDVKTDENDDDESFPHQAVMLLRFLRARGWNPEAAQAMYAKAAAWRKEVDIDHCLEEFHFSEQEAVASHGWRMYWHKTDKLGRPIFVQDLNNIDPAAVFGQCTTPERIIKRFATTLELACRERYASCTKEAGHLVEGTSSFAFALFSLNLQLQQLLGVLDANYPELSGRIVVINAPSLFSYTWSWIKGWLPAGTREKVDIQGTNFLPALLDWIEPASLPQSMGGTCDDCQEWMDGGREMEAMMGRLALVSGSNLGEEDEQGAREEGEGARRAWGAEKDAQSPWKAFGAEVRERRGPCKGGCERSDAGPWDRAVLRGR
ncbi:unnamed protein product [Tilletia caries]|nr:unnamed protein product [Tilletia caries]